MREPSSRERGPSTPQRLCDSVHATLAMTFTPARLFLSWADQPSITPGFQVRSTGASVVVRYVQLRDGALSLQRAYARTMIEQYSAALFAAGWQVEMVDQPRKMPYLRCSLANDFMSSKGTPCLI